MSDIDHTACIEALDRLQQTMNAAMVRANEQIAANQAKLDQLDQLDRTNAALAGTQMEMLRQIRNLLESGRTSDALRYVVALTDATARPEN